MKYLLIPVFLVAAGNIRGQAGAAYTALGGNAANPAAALILANNPASLSNYKNQLSFWYSQPFVNSEIKRGGIAFGHSFNNRALGISADYRGTAYYFRNTVSMQICQRWNQNISLGISAGIQMNGQAGYAQQYSPQGKLGLQYRITSKNLFSLVIQNPWSKISDHSKDSRADASLGFLVSNKTTIYLQFRTGDEIQTCAGLSLRHEFMERFYFYSAIQNGYEPVSFGFEFRKRKLSFAFGSAWHRYLGVTPALTLNILGE